MTDAASTPKPSPPAKSPSLRSLVNTIVLWAVVLFICFVAYSPQSAWLIFLVWLPIYLWWIWGRRLLAICLVPLCAAVIAAHVHGYRLIGLVHLVPNDLELGSDVVVAFGPGNLVTLADGRSFHLAGVRTAQDILLDRFDLANLGKPTSSMEPSAANNTAYPWAHLLNRLANGIAVDSPRRDHYLNLRSTGLPARVRPIDAQHAVIDVPIEYRPYYRGCSGSFDEQWFPPRVPRYCTIDLATALLGSGVIEPDDTEYGQRYRTWTQTHASHWKR